MSRPAFLVTETRSWLAVFVWTIILFLTIPLARSLQEVIRGFFGKTSFGYLVIAVVIAVTAFIIYRLKGHISFRSSNLWWLLVCAGVLIAYTIRLWDNPVEAVHFIQYGVLAALLFMAFAWRHKNFLIYPAVILATVIVGTIDEGIQWLIPKRVWGLSDIGINSLAAIIVCVAIAMCIRPKGFQQGINRFSIRLVLNLGIVCTLIMTLCLANTPNAIKWYGERIPALNYLAEDGHIMAEYGFLYKDEEIGIFRSRYSVDDLPKVDNQRALDAAEKLDAAPKLEDYGDFIRKYSPITDPFLHELRVHLNRRDYYLKTGQQQERYSSEERQRRLVIAWYENRIVEKYFPESLAQSSFTLSAQEREVARLGDTLSGQYESPVSIALITIISKKVLLAVLIIILLSLVYARIMIMPDSKDAQV